MLDLIIKADFLFGFKLTAGIKEKKLRMNNTKIS